MDTFRPLPSATPSAYPPPSPPPKPPPPKRRAMPASAAIPAQGPLSEYEEQRLRNMARNKAKLESLGCD